jgi:transposase
VKDFTSTELAETEESITPEGKSVQIDYLRADHVDRRRAATVTDPSHFRSGREFSAWLGLTARQNSSGGKDRLGRVSKMNEARQRFRKAQLCGMTGRLLTNRGRRALD